MNTGDSCVPAELSPPACLANLLNALSALKFKHRPVPTHTPWVQGSERVQRAHHACMTRDG